MSATISPSLLSKFLSQIKLPSPSSHKGQNGKLLIIGGSELFHAASKWSLDIASRLVDMVFYSSLPQNNQLIKEAKSNFWQGIVVPRTSLDDYLLEADAVLIGPGMERSQETAELTNQLLGDYPQKRWVVDAGALQMVDPTLLTGQKIITPHHTEFEGLVARGFDLGEATQLGVTTLLKGRVDRIYSASLEVGGTAQSDSSKSSSTTKSLRELIIEGGNPGLTKGGTGDVLAGLVAAFFTQSDALTSAVVGSFLNKAAADELFEQVGPFFNATDLVAQLPGTLWRLLK